MVRDGTLVGPSPARDSTAPYEILLDPPCQTAQNRRGASDLTALLIARWDNHRLFSSSTPTCVARHESPASSFLIECEQKGETPKEFGKHGCIELELKLECSPQLAASFPLPG